MAKRHRIARKLQSDEVEPELPYTPDLKAHDEETFEEYVARMDDEDARRDAEQARAGGIRRSRGAWEALEVYDPHLGSN